MISAKLEKSVFVDPEWRVINVKIKSAVEGRWW